MEDQKCDESKSSDPLNAINAACAAIQWMAGRTAISRATLLLLERDGKDQFFRDVITESRETQRIALLAALAHLDAGMQLLGDYLNNRDAIDELDIPATDFAFDYVPGVLKRMSDEDRQRVVEFLGVAVTALDIVNK